jgi:hypothetical protein
MEALFVDFFVIKQIESSPQRADDTHFAQFGFNLEDDA